MTKSTLTNNINKTQFYNIGNDNRDEPFEYRKPTINERLDHVHISLDQVKYQVKNVPMRQTTNDDVELLESWNDNLALMLGIQNKRISDIEASIEHCTYQI